VDAQQQSLFSSAQPPMYHLHRSPTYQKQKPIAVQGAGQFQLFAVTHPFFYSPAPPHLYLIQLNKQPFSVQKGNQLFVSVPDVEKSSKTVIPEQEKPSTPLLSSQKLKVTHAKEQKKRRKPTRLVIYKAILDPKRRKETVLQPSYGKHPKNVSKEGIKFKTVLGKNYNTSRIIDKPSKGQLLQLLKEEEEEEEK